MTLCPHCKRDILEATTGELPTHFGPWLVKQKEGEGGNSHIYSVVHEQTNKGAVVKTPKWLKPRLIRRFRDEVAALDRFKSHTGVIPILDHWLPDSDNAEEGSVPWLAKWRRRPLYSAVP